jgi:hypothetical protein
MSAPKRHNRLFAIYPNSYGFAFVVFEGSLAPVAWGIKNVRGKRKNKQCLRYIKATLKRYEPDAMVLQDMSPTGTVRARRITVLNDSIQEMAEDFDIPTYLISRAQVRNAFVYLGVTTKQAIAEAVAKHVPAFARYLPPVRKPWMSEDARMGLFDAAALAWTFFRGLEK